MLFAISIRQEFDHVKKSKTILMIGTEFSQIRRLEYVFINIQFLLFINLPTSVANWAS